jgi:hypothetical protein
MKILIKDTNTNQYYAVGCEANPKGFLSNAQDEGSPDINDFPFWTDNIDEAYDFGSKNLAINEMNMNDTTDNGTRNPIIVAE